MFVHKHLEALVSGDVFLNSGQLVARNVFGDVTAIFAVLEIVIRLAVRTDADDGEMTALHRGDGGHLFDASGRLIRLHA